MFGQALLFVRFLKNALLLWDEVRFICPYYSLPQRFQGEAEGAAFDLIAKPLDPSSEEKRQVHDAVVELANPDIPDWFIPNSRREDEFYHIHPGKLLPETWDELQRANLARATTGFTDDPPWPGS